MLRCRGLVGERMARFNLIIARMDTILKVLKAGIRWGGASELAFITPDGTEGNYQDHTLAYGHEGEPCERCHKGIFRKFFLGGRGTYVCPACQK